MNICLSWFFVSSFLLLIFTSHIQELIALNPLNDTAHDAVRALLRELAELFPDVRLHIGGDQTQFECWPELLESHSIAALQVNVTNTQQLLVYYTARLMQTLADANVTKQAVLWPELAALTPTSFADDVPVHVWRNNSVHAAAVAATGSRPIISSVGWSLGEPYADTPLSPPSSQQQQRFVLVFESTRASAYGNRTLLYPQVCLAHTSTNT